MTDPHSNVVRVFILPPKLNERFERYAKYPEGDGGFQGCVSKMKEREVTEDMTEEMLTEILKLRPNQPGLGF